MHHHAEQPPWLKKAEAVIPSLPRRNRTGLGGALRRSLDMEIVNGFEIFRDKSCFDMWAVQRKGNKDFYKVRHFDTREEAVSFTKD